MLNSGLSLLEIAAEPRGLSAGITASSTMFRGLYAHVYFEAQPRL